MVNGGRAGFSLVEAVLALLLFGSGVLVLGGAVLRSVERLREAESRSGAIVLAASVTDSLMQLASPVSGGGVRGRYRLDWSVADSGAVAAIVVRIHWSDGTRPLSDSLQSIAGVAPERLHVVP